MVKNRSKNEAVKQCERRSAQNSEGSGIGRLRGAATGRVEGRGRVLPYKAGQSLEADGMVPLGGRSTIKT